MKLSSDSIQDGRPIPAEFAFCKPEPAKHVTLSSNQNPQLAWDDVPAATQSFALICNDPDVPSKADDLFKEDREIPASLSRIDFYHWVLVDIAPTQRAIEAATYSKEVKPRGKNGPAALNNTRQGLNGYTEWFATDHDMSGDYFGYDGPCPPWNDSIVHRYVFTLYALDFARVPVEGKFKAPDVLRAIEGRVLAKAQLTGTYTLNPRLA
ncbi:MAG: YbhB/YbcL family Raf kinase inhibitor-like protein [Burkholderiaceae bacterium]